MKQLPRFELEPVGSLGNRFAIKYHTHKGNETRIGSAEFTNKNNADLFVNMANEGLRNSKDLMEPVTQVYKVELTVSPQSVREMTGHDHVSPAIIEQMLSSILTEALQASKVGISLTKI